MKKIILCVFSIALIIGCGGGGGGDTNNISNLMPSVAIASPTMVNGAATSSIKVSDNTDFVSKKASLEAILGQTTVDDCLKTFKSYIINEPSVDCYGPSINITYNTETCTAGPDILPIGDIGIWENTESTGEACLAAKINSQVNYVGSYVDTAVKMLYSMVCAYKVKNNVSVINEGDTSDLSSDINEKVSGAAVTKATFSYKSGTFSASIAGKVSNTTVDINLLNVVTKKDETFTHNGIIYGSMLVNNVDKEVFSALYNMSETGNTETDKYEVKVRSANATEPDSALFNSDHSIKYWSTTPNPPQGGTYTKIQLNESGAGTIYYAWQAGAQDSNTRVFQAETNGSTGYGYFGYGPNLNDGDSSGNLGSITGMICYWTGPGHSVPPTMHSGTVQAQALQKNSNNIYVPAANYTKYMLSNSCNYTACVGHNFTYRKGGDTGSWTEFDTNFDNELVNYSSATNGSVSSKLGAISTIAIEGL